MDVIELDNLTHKGEWKSFSSFSTSQSIFNQWRRTGWAPRPNPTEYVWKNSFFFSCVVEFDYQRAGLSSTTSNSTNDISSFVLSCRMPCAKHCSFRSGYIHSHVIWILLWPASSKVNPGKCLHSSQPFLDSKYDMYECKTISHSQRVVYVNILCVLMKSTWPCGLFASFCGSVLAGQSRPEQRGALALKAAWFQLPGSSHMGTGKPRDRQHWYH